MTIHFDVYTGTQHGHRRMDIYAFTEHENYRAVIDLDKRVATIERVYDDEHDDISAVYEEHGFIGEMADVILDRHEEGRLVITTVTDNNVRHSISGIPNLTRSSYAATRASYVSVDAGSP